MDAQQQALDPTRASEAEIEVAHLRRALASRTITAQATGLLAARFQLPTEAAWNVLTELSNRTQEKLVTVARVIMLSHDGMQIPDEDRAAAVAVARTFDLALVHQVQAATRRSAHAEEEEPCLDLRAAG